MNIKHPLPMGSKLYREIGHIYGWLKVTAIYQNEKGYIKCTCLCTRCKKETEVYLSNLKAGRTRSCGCLEDANRRNFVNLKGQIFDDLRVEEKTEQRKDGCVVWKCVCMKCGNISYRTGKDLKKGYATRCRCTPFKRRNASYKDLAGQRFNLLTAKYPTDKRDGKGSVIWHCTCRCGREADVSEDALVHGNRISCGCKKIEAGQKLIERRHLVDGTCIEALDRKIRTDNSTGVPGVHALENRRYKATLGFKGNRYNLGTFDTFSEAAMVRIEAHQMIHIGFKESYRLWCEKNMEDQTWGKINPFVFEVIQNSDYSFTVTNSMEKYLLQDQRFQKQEKAIAGAVNIGILKAKEQEEEYDSMVYSSDMFDSRREHWYSRYGISVIRQDVSTR